MKFQPVIKWSGSKRSQAKEIVDLFPKKITNYYEPFCGGASVLFELINRNDIEVNNYFVSDLNPDLIGLFNKIKENPNEVSEHYAKLWHEMNDGVDDKAFKRSYYEKVRERFNKERNPFDFMFIMRTTVNGMPRYNADNQFNNAFHITRNGIEPEKLDKIIHQWSDKLNEKDVQFRCVSYDKIHPLHCFDFIYLDPPYARTKGMYFGGFDNKLLFEWLSSIKCPWILSYDGKSGDVDNTYEVPEDLYEKHIYLKSGKSSFRRIIGKGTDSVVYESLYLKLGWSTEQELNDILNDQVNNEIAMEIFNPKFVDTVKPNDEKHRQDFLAMCKIYNEYYDKDPIFQL